MMDKEYLKMIAGNPNFSRASIIIVIDGVNAVHSPHAA
jgi:hypothetical protein